MKKLIVGGIIIIAGSILSTANPTEYKTTFEVSRLWEPVPIECFYIEATTQSVSRPVKSKYEPREFTYDEAQMLMRIAQAEAGNQGKEGMYLVMSVILNRVKSPDFPNTIEDVVFQSHQFQPVSDGRYYTVELSAEAHEALAEIEEGTPIDESIIAFEVTSNKRTLEKYFRYAYTVGEHDFYTKKGEK